MATRVQLVYVNRGTSEFPGVKYETEVIEEGQYSRVSDGFFKTVIIIPIDEDIYFDIGPNPDPSNVGKQFIVARGSEREIKFSRDTRIAIKASGTEINNFSGGDAEPCPNPEPVRWTDIIEKPEFMGVGPTSEAARDAINAASRAVVDMINSGLMSPQMFDKLDRIHDAATKNETDAYLVDRANHTGTQNISTIEGLEDRLGSIEAGEAEFVEWNNVRNKPTVIGAGETALEARTAIEAASTEPASSASPGLLVPEDKIKLDSVMSRATENRPDSELLDRSNHTGTQNISTIDGLQTILDDLSSEAGAHDWDNIQNKPTIIASGADRSSARASIDAASNTVANAESDGLMSASDKVKLDTVQDSATRNRTDAYLLSRSNHTGTQEMSTVLGLEEKIEELETPAPRRNIYLLATGQSNMARIDRTNIEANYDYPSNLNYWNFEGWENEYGTAFRKLNNNEVSTAMSYARMVALDNKDADVWVVNVSFGGTPITAWSENVPIAASDTFMENTRRAVSVLEGLGHTDIRFEKILWWQGEADSDGTTEAEYVSRFDTWMENLNSLPQVDKDSIQIIVFGIAGPPRLAWPGYHTVNKYLQNLVSRYGGQASYLNVANLEDSFWVDDVHASGPGYYKLGKRAYIASKGGIAKLMSNYVHDDAIRNVPALTGNGLLFPEDRGIDYVQEEGWQFSKVMEVYAESYISEDMAVAGRTTAGTGTYGTRGGQITRAGNIVTLLFTCIWNDHTGTGPMVLHGIPFSNIFELPVTIRNVTFIDRTDPDNPVEKDYLARWDLWEKTLSIHEWIDGVLTPVNVVPNGSILINSTLLRLGSV